jgi:hypothetical protein
MSNGREAGRLERFGPGGAIIGLVTLAVILLIVGAIAFTAYSTYGTQRTVTFTVNHRERTGGDEGKYLVYTNEEGVFEDTDTIFYLKFDSSDVYNQLREGGEYQCDVYGWRVPLFSWYPNIKSCTTLKEGHDGQ